MPLPRSAQPGTGRLTLDAIHWHLSDDQAFRAESRKFPRFTQVGSDGLYYTQDEMQHIVCRRPRPFKVVTIDC